ncbi:alpha/beta hydrolase family protein [Nocardiopsis sp. NPDC058631]|uniref:alpha/beta hydrolase family protein n=1 Tax=Nocardiopsis sp. NPDC058631 TaxID=3346566 RepID=UPI00364EA8FA
MSDSTGKMHDDLIDAVGISDLTNYLRTQPESVRPGLVDNFYRHVGDPAVPEQEADMLPRSPIARINQIRTPLLVTQGANDVRVAKAESDNIVGSLRPRGVDVGGGRVPPLVGGQARDLLRGRVEVSLRRAF